MKIEFIGRWVSSSPYLCPSQFCPIFVETHAMQEKQTNPGTPFVGSEDRFSAEFSQWAWNYHPETRYTLFHVENEKEKLNGESAASFVRRLSKAKAKGVVPGVWDYFWFWKGKVYVIELKVGRGVLSDDQKKFRDAILKQFPEAEFCVFWSLDEVKEWVRERI